MMALLQVALLSLVPVTELRGAIPFGVWARHLPLGGVVLVCVAANWLAALITYLFIRYVLVLLLRSRAFARLWGAYAAGVQKRMHKNVERWGAWGLAMYIGFPLPGTGVYSGAIAAYLLGMSFRRFMWVALAGVLLMATIVTAVVVTGNAAFMWLVKPPA
jgi:uncharacterized membrane protein